MEDFQIKESDAFCFPGIVNDLFLALLPGTLERYDDVEGIYLGVQTNFIPFSLREEFMRQFAAEIRENTGLPSWFVDDPDYIAGPNVKRKLQWFRYAQAILRHRVIDSARIAIEFEDEVVYFDTKYSGMTWKELALLPNCGLLTEEVLDFYYSYDNQNLKNSRERRR